MQAIFNELPSNFFEPVTYHQLDCRAGKFNVSSDYHYVFNFEDKFIGIKKSPSIHSLPFFLHHEESLKMACMIYEQTFNQMPNELLFFHNEQKNWNAFIVGYRSEEEQLAYYNNLFTSSVRADIDYFPMVGAFNTFEFGENPFFSLLITSPFDKGKYSFLSLEDYRFPKDSGNDLLKRQYKGQLFSDAALANTSKIIASSFRDADDQFKQILGEYSGKKLDYSYFAPIILDLYNINRNVESIKNDEKLERKIRHHSELARLFIPKNTAATWTTIIAYMVRYSDFKITNGIFPKNNILDIFAQKQSYKKFETIFSKFVNDEPRFIRYADDQVADWNRIKHLI